MAIDPRAFVGVRFRLHGRDRHGLDCVGLVVAAFALDAVPGGYRLRTADTARIDAGLRAAGFRAVGSMKAGDVLLLKPGPAQRHLAIVSADGFVHADAGLGRVVEVPGAPPWPVLTCYRRD